MAAMFTQVSAAVRRYFDQLLTPRRLTPASVRMAYLVAAAVDGIQLLLGPLGWAGIDEILDVAAMYATTRLLGFHPLLLPTFLLEFVPLTDMLPTWIGCVALVIRIRKGQGMMSDEPPGSPPVIDVKAKRVE